MPDDRERLRAILTDEPQTPAALAAALGLPDAIGVGFVRAGAGFLSRGREARS